LGSSQIEARFVSWWAGAKKLVDAFTNKRDVYSEQASLWYGRTVTKKDEDERNVGKTLTLGGNYGIGWPKVATEFLRGPMGAKPIQFTMADVEKLNIGWWVRQFRRERSNWIRMGKLTTRLNTEGLLVHCAVSGYFVDQYRTVNKEIPDLWELCERVLKRMSLGEEFAFGPAENPELFVVSNQSVILPGGSVMHYPGLKRSDGNWVYQTEQGPRHIYGAHFVENMTQAACGVIVTDQMMETIEAGWPVKMMTYDELSAVVKEQQAEQCLKEMGDIMERTPANTPGLPLSSEGGYARRYGDAK